MNTNTTFRAVLAVALVALTVGAWAQPSNLRIQLESIRPTIDKSALESINPEYGPQVESLKPLDNPLESILYDKSHGWVTGNRNLDIYTMDVEWGAVDGVTVSRKMKQERFEVKGRPLNIGLRDTETQGLVLTPIKGMQLRASTQRVETRDLTSALLGGTEVDTFAFQQAYGAGSSAGTMGFTRTVTETLSPDSKDGFGGLETTLTRIEEEMSLSQALALLGDAAKIQYKRNVSTTQRPDVARSVQTAETFGLDMGLWAQTHMVASYARSDANTQQGVHSQDRSITFSRQFNSGKAAVTWGNQSVRNNLSTTQTKKQSYLMPFRIDGTTVAMQYDATTVQVDDKLTKEDRAASFATKLGGQDVTASWSRAFVNKSGVDNKTSKVAFSLPFSFFEQKAGFSFTSDSVQANTALVSKSRVAKLNLPLERFVKGANLTYDIAGVQAKAGQPFVETRTTTLLMPVRVLGNELKPTLQRITERSPAGKTMKFLATLATPVRMFDRKIETSHQWIAINRPDGSQQDRLVTNLTVPFKAGNVTVARDETTEIAANGTESQTRVVNVASPRVPLVATASVQADYQAKSMPGDIDHHTTHLNIEAKPMASLKFTGDYRITDLGAAQDTRERRVDMGYDLSKRLSLNWRYLEREQLDKSPLIQRTMVLQKTNAKPSDLRLRAALTSTDDHNADGDVMKIVEVGVGDRKRFLEANLKYQEYDEGKLTDLGEPIVQIGLTHDREGITYSMGYEDQKGRVEPRREYGVGIPLGQAALGLKLSQNAVDPRDPKKQAIRLADVYDATLSSKIMGDVDLNLLYRYCDRGESATAEQIDQWLQMKLSGGKAAKGGAVQIAYASGEFIDLVDSKIEKTPTSKFTLQYEKQWDEEGNKLTVHFDRTIMPEQSSTDGNYEGRVQFDYKF